MKNKLSLVLSTVFVIALLVAGCTAPQASATQLPASPTATVEAPTATTGSASATPVISASPTSTSPSSETVPSTAGLVQFSVVSGQIEARYKVREQLAGNDLPNDAIGKTSQVSGSVSFKSDGTVDPTTSKFVVKAGTLATDRSTRDNYVRRNILQTDQFPDVVFIPTRITGLSWPLPQSGSVTFQVIGNLTIRSVTKEVTWDVTGNLNGNQATGLARTSFKFEDFNLDQPRVPIVLSVVNQINLELEGTLQLGSGS